MVVGGCPVELSVDHELEIVVEGAEPSCLCEGIAVVEGLGCLVGIIVNRAWELAVIVVVV